MNITTADYFVIGIYMTVLIGIGLYAGRQVKTSEDYALAGRRLGMPVLLGTLIGTAIGASATLGKAGKAYEVGYAIILSSIAYVIGYLIFAVIAPHLRKANINTVPDALERRYGSKMRLFGSVILFITVVVFFSAQLIAFGITATTLLGGAVTYEQAVCVAAAVIIFYTLFGGLLAVALTDLMQTVVILIGGGLLLPFFVFKNVKSWEGLTETLQSPTENFMGGMDLPYLAAFTVTFIAFVIIDPTLWQRAAAAKNSKNIRPAVFTTAGIYALWSILMVILGVAAFNLLPSLASGDAAIPTLMVNYLPPVVTGLVLSAIMALIMSTADTALLIAGTTVSSDMVGAQRPETPDKTLLLISRTTIAVVGALGTILALTKAPVFDVMLLALGIFVAGIFVPVIAALYWKKASSMGATLAAAVGVGSELILTGLKYGAGLDLWVEPILVALALSFITMWISGYVIPPTTRPLFKSSSKQAATLNTEGI